MKPIQTFTTTRPGFGHALTSALGFMLWLPVFVGFALLLMLACLLLPSTQSK